ncbi:MAG: hypothetical protein ABIT58_01795 [Ferruginibacter sp.]
MPKQVQPENDQHVEKTMKNNPQMFLNFDVRSCMKNSGRMFGSGFKKKPPIPVGFSQRTINLFTSGFSHI